MYQPTAWFQQAKERNMRQLDERREYATYESDGNLDLAILPYLDKINLIQGVATFASCSGHRITRYPNNNGYISIYLDRQLWRDLYMLERSLEGSPLIMKFDPFDDGRRALHIGFKGEESGMLDESMDLVVRALSKLSRESCVDKVTTIVYNGDRLSKAQRGQHE